MMAKVFAALSLFILVVATWIGFAAYDPKGPSHKVKGWLNRTVKCPRLQNTPFILTKIGLGAGFVFGIASIIAS